MHPTLCPEHPPQAHAPPSLRHFRRRTPPPARSASPPSRCSSAPRSWPQMTMQQGRAPAWRGKRRRASLRLARPCAAVPGRFQCTAVPRQGRHDRRLSSASWRRRPLPPTLHFLGNFAGTSPSTLPSRTPTLTAAPITDGGKSTTGAEGGAGHGRSVPIALLACSPTSTADAQGRACNCVSLPSSRHTLSFMCRYWCSSPSSPPPASNNCGVACTTLLNDPAKNALCAAQAWRSGGSNWGFWATAAKFYCRKGCPCGV